MAHELEADDKMFSARLAPWHYSETKDRVKITDRTLTKDEAYIQSGLNWDVEKRPLFFCENPVESKLDGSFSSELVQRNYIDTLEAFGVVRTSDNKCLGIVGEGYNPIQNSESFEFTDALLQEGATYETAGSLFGGKRIWICAKLRSIDILGDEVGEFLVLANSHDGSMPMTGMITPVRVVCNNTLRMAVDRASRIVKIRHTKNATDRIETARSILSLAHKYTDAIRDNADKMVTIPFNGIKLDQFIDQTFGYDPDSDTVSTRMKNSLDTDRDFFVSCLQAKDIEKFSGTAWGTFQALSDFDSHREVARDNQNSRDRNFLRIIDGSNTWLENATKTMMEIAVA